MADSNGIGRNPPPLHSHPSIPGPLCSAEATLLLLHFLFHTACPPVLLPLPCSQGPHQGCRQRPHRGERPHGQLRSVVRGDLEGWVQEVQVLGRADNQGRVGHGRRRPVLESGCEGVPQLAPMHTVCGGDCTPGDFSTLTTLLLHVSPHSEVLEHAAYLGMAAMLVGRVFSEDVRHPQVSKAGCLAGGMAGGQAGWARDGQEMMQGAWHCLPSDECPAPSQHAACFRLTKLPACLPTCRAVCLPGLTACCRRCRHPHAWQTGALPRMWWLAARSPTCCRCGGRR